MRSHLVIAVTVWCCVASISAPVDGKTVIALSLNRSGMNDVAGQLAIAAAPVAEMESALGPVTYDVHCPENRENLETWDSWKAYDQRTVKVHLGKAGVAYREVPLLVPLLAGAADAAVSQCPIHELTPNGPGDRGDVGLTEIYGRPSPGSGERLLGKTKGYSALYGTWDEIIDVYADEAAAEEASRAVASPPPEPAMPIMENHTVLAPPPTLSEPVAEALPWMKILMGGTAMLVLFIVAANFEGLAIWFYGLRPHPAKQMVEQAIDHDRPLDGPLFDELTSTEYESRYEAEARTRQAEALAERLRRHAAALRAEEAKRMDAERHRVAEETDKLRRRNAAREAAVDHEAAAARLDQLKQRTKGE